MLAKLEHILQDWSLTPWWSHVVALVLLGLAVLLVSALVYVIAKKPFCVF